MGTRGPARAGRADHLFEAWRRRAAGPGNRDRRSVRRRFRRRRSARLGRDGAEPGGSWLATGSRRGLAGAVGGDGEEWKRHHYAVHGPGGSVGADPAHRGARSSPGALPVQERGRRTSLRVLVCASFVQVRGGDGDRAARRRASGRTPGGDEHQDFLAERVDRPGEAGVEVGRRDRAVVGCGIDSIRRCVGV